VGVNGDGGADVATMGDATMGDGAVETNRSVGKTVVLLDA